MIHRTILENGEVIENFFTKEEIDEVKASEKRLQKEQAEADAKAAQRQALLNRLGITEEEARILLGGN
jgi:hypothetical protein